MTTLPIDVDLSQSPAGENELVPFRPENRMTTFLVGAVLILCVMAVWCVKVIGSSPNPNSTPAWAFAGASLLLSFKILIGMLQTEFARRDIKADNSRTRHDLKAELHNTSLLVQTAALEVVKRTNGGLTNAVNAAGEQARQAEHEQMMDDPEFRKRLAQDLCPMLAKQIAVELRNPPPGVQT